MAAKYYAWTTIKLGNDSIAPGTVVSSKDIGNDWSQLVAAGAIRTKVYPKIPVTFTGSVRSFRMEQLRKLREDVDGDIDDLLDEEDAGEQVA